MTWPVRKTIQPELNTGPRAPAQTQTAISVILPAGHSAVPNKKTCRTIVNHLRKNILLHLPQDNEAKLSYFTTSVNCLFMTQLTIL